VSFGMSGVIVSRRSSDAGDEWVDIFPLRTCRDNEGESSGTGVDINRSDSFEVRSTDMPNDCSGIGDELGDSVVGMHEQSCSFEILGAVLS
jgi:hypothetical protein